MKGVVIERWENNYINLLFISFVAYLDHLLFDFLVYFLIILHVCLLVCSLVCISIEEFQA